MGYTFEKANTYAKKHNVSYCINRINNMYRPEIEYEVTICDAFDGYLSSETYNIVYDAFYGYRFERRHFRYAFKKDDALVSRICSALNDDSFDVVLDCWIGAE